MFEFTRRGFVGAFLAFVAGLFGLRWTRADTPRNETVHFTPLPSLWTSMYQPDKHPMLMSDTGNLDGILTWDDFTTGLIFKDARITLYESLETGNQSGVLHIRALVGPCAILAQFYEAFGDVAEYQKHKLKLRLATNGHCKQVESELMEIPRGLLTQVGVAVVVGGMAERSEIHMYISGPIEVDGHPLELADVAGSTPVMQDYPHFRV